MLCSEKRHHQFPSLSAFSLHPFHVFTFPNPFYPVDMCRYMGRYVYFTFYLFFIYIYTKDNTDKYSFALCFFFNQKYIQGIIAHQFIVAFLLFLKKIKLHSTPLSLLIYSPIYEHFLCFH